MEVRRWLKILRGRSCWTSLKRRYRSLMKKRSAAGMAEQMRRRVAVSLALLRPDQTKHNRLEFSPKIAYREIPSNVPRTRRPPMSSSAFAPVVVPASQQNLASHANGHQRPQSPVQRRGGVIRASDLP
ncbi:hypothetical protein NL676_039558 [Syzygium grande]|nr:hypothetical protein NL676_039558 [Syzygium grande]